MGWFRISRTAVGNRLLFLPILPLLPHYTVMVRSMDHHHAKASPDNNLNLRASFFCSWELNKPNSNFFFSPILDYDQLARDKWLHIIWNSCIFILPLFLLQLGSAYGDVLICLLVWMNFIWEGEETLTQLRSKIEDKLIKQFNASWSIDLTTTLHLIVVGP